MTTPATEPTMGIIEWAAHAKRGDQYTYARGNLAFSRHIVREANKEPLPDKHGRLPIIPVPSEADVMNHDGGSDAWRLHERRQVALVQRRMGADDFAYIAQRL